MEKQDILKLTLPKLRETALETIENIQGVHGMDKVQLIDILFDHFGIPPDEKVKKAADPELKKKIKDLQAKKADAYSGKDQKQAKILQRKIHNLKRLTRS